MKRKNQASIRTSKYGNTVAITNFHSGFQIRLKQLSALALTILKNNKLKQTALSLVFVSDSAIKHLNKRYLSHSWVTDVLAFPFSNSVGEKFAAQNCSFLGEVIISPKRAKVYAKKLNVSFEEELVRYICHGLLHLEGYSDKSHAGKIKMRQTENRLLKPVARKLKGII